MGVVAGDGERVGVPVTMIGPIGPAGVVVGTVPVRVVVAVAVAPTNTVPVAVAAATAVAILGCSCVSSD